MLRVGHLRMELQTVDAGLRVAHGRHRAVFRFAQHLEARRHPDDAVPVTHPDSFARPQAGKHPGWLNHTQGGGPVFHRVARSNLPLELLTDQLVAVTQAQYRQSQVEQRGVVGGLFAIVDAGGTAGENQAADIFEIGSVGLRRANIGVDVETANAVGDEMGVLPAEVQNDDALGQAQTFGSVAKTG